MKGIEIYGCKFTFLCSVLFFRSVWSVGIFANHKKKIVITGIYFYNLSIQTYMENMKMTLPVHFWNYSVQIGELSFNNLHRVGFSAVVQIRQFYLIQFIVRCPLCEFLLILPAWTHFYFWSACRKYSYCIIYKLSSYLFT